MDKHTTHLCFSVASLQKINSIWASRFTSIANNQYQQCNSSHTHCRLWCNDFPGELWQQKIKSARESQPGFSPAQTQVHEQASSRPAITRRCTCIQKIVRKEIRPVNKLSLFREYLHNKAFINIGDEVTGQKSRSDGNAIFEATASCLLNIKGKS